MNLIHEICWFPLEAMWIKATPIQIFNNSWLFLLQSWMLLVPQDMYGFFTSILKNWGRFHDFGGINGYKMIEGSLEVKLPTIWTDEKQSRAEAERREKIRRERVRKKEDADARKGRKVAKHCVFPMICGSGGSKSRLAKAAGAEPAGHRSDEKLHAVVARSTFWSQNVQNTPGSIRTTFGSWDVEKVHAVVARSTFPSQKC